MFKRSNTKSHQPHVINLGALGPGPRAFNLVFAAAVTFIVAAFAFIVAAFAFMVYAMFTTSGAEVARAHCATAPQPDKCMEMLGYPSATREGRTR